MKKIIVIGACVLVVLAGGAYGYTQLSRPAPAPVAVAAPPVAAAKAVVAEARVVPARSAALSLPIGGMVADVLVKEGDQVTAGQVIARLDATQLQARVAGAQAALAEARPTTTISRPAPRPSRSPRPKRSSPPPRRRSSAPPPASLRPTSRPLGRRSRPARSN